MKKLSIFHYTLAYLTKIVYNQIIIYQTEVNFTMNICCYGAASDRIDKKFLEGGKALGLEMGARGHGLVFGGGATGMMGACARGVHENGGKVVGVAPRFFDKEGVLYKKCDEFYWTDTMRERKQKMQDLSDAFVVMPGGIGTFEEFFEMITLVSLGQLEKPIVIFNIGGYYDKLCEAIGYAEECDFMFTSPDSLYRVFTSEKEVLDYIENI